MASLQPALRAAFVAADRLACVVDVAQGRPRTVDRRRGVRLLRAYGGLDERGRVIVLES